MDIEMVRCECCGLKEDCTQDYIHQVKSTFNGKWLCGLCSEAVRYELNRSCKKKSTVNNKQHIKSAVVLNNDMNEAVRAHMSVCGKYCKSNPATLVADGMKQMLIRRRSSSGHISK